MQLTACTVLCTSTLDIFTCAETTVKSISNTGAMSSVMFHSADVFAVDFVSGR